MSLEGTQLTLQDPSAIIIDETDINVFYGSIDYSW